MSQDFRFDADATPEMRISQENLIAPTSNRESIKILIMGSPKGVNNTIQTLYRLGFAEVTAWSSLQPTANPGEVVSILIRQISIR